MSSERKRETVGKPDTLGNAAAMREALVKIRDKCVIYNNDLAEEIDALCGDALASPARNCDMFNDRRSAFEYFRDNELWKYNRGLSAEYWFSEWLLAPAEKGGAE